VSTHNAFRRKFAVVWWKIANFLRVTPNSLILDAADYISRPINALTNSLTSETK